MNRLPLPPALLACVGRALYGAALAGCWVAASAQGLGDGVAGAHQKPPSVELKMAPAYRAMDAQGTAAFSSAELRVQVLALLAQAARRSPDAAQVQRVEIDVGAMDTRLRLAACAQIQAYLPSGARTAGLIRMGLRCLQGAKHWSIYLPVTLRLWGRGWVIASSLPAGATLTDADLRWGEVDFAIESSASVVQAEAAVGRQLLRPVQAGSSLRAAALKPRRFFAAGDPVKLLVRGPGFQVSAQAQAMMPGDEGLCVRVRTEAGRVLCGRASAGAQVEVSL